MNQANATADTTADAIEGEEDLDRAIDELRGVLRDDTRPSDDGGGFVLPGDQEEEDSPVSSASNSGIIMNIPVDVQIVLGSTEMQVSDLMALRKGATVALDRRIGEPVDVVVNGRRIARGEITVLESDPSRFGIKLTEIISAAKKS